MDTTLISSDALEDRIYVIRGVQAMLDFDLAEIYGYTTKDFNRQVKNNIEKFDEDFRFQLTRGEFEEIVRCKISTSRAASMFSGQSGGTRYLPYAFTEQGIYMLMTVLHGELAIRQSKALIRLFKQMKDYIVSTRLLLDPAIASAFMEKMLENTEAIYERRGDVDTIKGELAETRSTLAQFMAGFEASAFGREYLILDGQALEATVAYRQLYNLATSTIFIIDNYIGPKTLLNLKAVPSHVAVTLFSDNAGKGLSRSELNDFRIEYPQVNLRFIRTNGTFHDRFIILDYGLETERIFICGSSSKDAGRRVTVIIESKMHGMYHPVVDSLLSNELLRLK